MIEVSRAILRSVANLTGIGVSQMQGDGRARDVVRARHFAAYCLMNIGGLSSTVAGHTLNRDHSTVLHGCGLVRMRIAREDETTLRWLAVVREEANSATLKAEDNRSTQVDLLNVKIRQAEENLLSLYRRREVLLDFSKAALAVAKAA